VLSDRISSPPPETSREGGYLTGTVDVRNREVLLSSDYQPYGQRVRYLLITAQYVPPGTPPNESSREPEIPVLLLDNRTDSPQIEDPHDLDVISRYPLAGSGSGLGRMAFRLRVLREDAGDVVLKVWDAVNAVGAVAEIDPTGTLSLANRLMEVMRPFLADEPHTQVASFQVEKVADAEMATAWVILPVRPDGRLPPRLKERWDDVRRGLRICQLDGGPWLCRGEARLEGFPYLLVRYRHDDYRSDPDLLSRRWRDAIGAPGTCPPPADASDWVFRAWSALSHDVWSPQQKEAEKALLRGNLWCLHFLQGSLPAGSALGLYLQCRENLPARLPETHPLALQVNPAVENLERCVRAKAMQIEGFDAVNSLIEAAAEVRAARMAGTDPWRLPLADLKRGLRRSTEALARVQGLGVERSRYVREVTTWREELEKALYMRVFASQVELLARANEPSPALVRELEQMLAGLAAEGVECVRCRDEVRHARDLEAAVARLARLPAAIQRVQAAILDPARRQDLLRDLGQVGDLLRGQHDGGTCDAETLRRLDALLFVAESLPVPQPPTTATDRGD